MDFYIALKLFMCLLCNLTINFLRAGNDLSEHHAYINIHVSYICICEKNKWMITEASSNFIKSYLGYQQNGPSNFKVRQFYIH